MAATKLNMLRPAQIKPVAAITLRDRRASDPGSGPIQAIKLPFQFAAWLVDLDGTLYHHRPVRAIMAMQLALFGWPAVKILQAFRRQQEVLRDEVCESAGDVFDLQIKRTAELLHIPESAVAVVVAHWMVDRPGRWLRTFRRRPLLAAIGTYRNQGGKVALVSDYPARKKLNAMGVDSLFDVIVACGEPGGPPRLKPAPHGLILAAEQLCVAPFDCLVIGDRPMVDGEAAIRAGMSFRHACSRWAK